MSCNGWESGTILLPRQSVAGVRKVVREAVNELHASNYRKARELWQRHGTELRRSVVAAQEKGTPYANFWGIVDEADETYEVMDALRKAAEAGKAPKHDFVRPHATTRAMTTVELHVASIRFDGRKLHWAVGWNNHAREEAHEHLVVAALFKTLDRLAWTRGSGGVIVGNDEYNRDNVDAGGGGNYITFAFGPLGEQGSLA